MPCKNLDLGILILAINGSNLLFIFLDVVVGRNPPVKFSRSNPSPRFKELAQFYRDMHQQGDQLKQVPADKTFDGKSLRPHILAVKQAVEEFQLKTLLDYGCGKATFYDRAELETPNGKTLRGLKQIWGVDGITLYDPGFEPYSQLPSGTFDGVICTDVMEHCSEEDIDWIIDELFAFSNRYLLCSIACYPAKKLLPNGENVHITLKKPGWWIDKFHDAASKRAAVDYYLWLGIVPNRDSIMVRGELLGS